jgi:hypothetical protein
MRLTYPGDYMNMAETMVPRVVARRILIRWWGIGVILTCLFFAGNSFSSAPSSLPGRPRERAVKIGYLPPIARQRAQGLAGNLALSSLEMKENVDFLLTPALLVQEALSSDVIQTYPAE